MRKPLFDHALLELTERLLRAQEPSELAAHLLDAVVTTYGFPRGLVVTSDDGQHLPVAAHAAHHAPAGAGRSRIVARAEETGLQVVPRLAGDREPWLSRFLPAGASVVVLPLAVDKRPLGALVLQLPAALRAPHAHPLFFHVDRMAGYGALALDRLQRLAQLQRLAVTDDLTRIENRRGFLASLDREIARSVRSGDPFSLVMLDIDRFKQVNDLHGHPAGDEALRNVAAALSIACRELDTAARYGGEEFVVLLPTCGADECVAIAERLREAVQSAPGAIRLTASAGVATFPLHADDSEQLVRAADAALLAAKRSGRNRTVMAHTPPSGHSDLTNAGAGARLTNQHQERQ